MHHKDGACNGIRATTPLVSLGVGLVVLAFAVLFGGVAAISGEHGRSVMPGLGTFATVASVAIALLHLLPESVAEIGWPALIATAAAFFGPFLLERLIPHRPESEDGATILLGYIAVLLHQAGEGTLIASLARTGALSISIIVAIAAHTAPLGMIVAISALESTENAKKGMLRALVALVGCALATTIGAFSIDFVGSARVATMRPWLIASVAGLLLHALTHASTHTHHHAHAHTHQEDGRKLKELLAGLLGIGLAIASLESDGWVRALSWPLRGAGLFVLASAVALKTYWPKKDAEHLSRSAERDPRAG